MRTFILLCVFIAAASAALARIERKEERIPDRYIIKLKDSSNLDEFVQRLEDRLRSVNSNVEIKFRYEHALTGLAVRIPDESIEAIRSLEGIEYIEEDGIVRTQAVGSWGLDRVDQRYLPLDGVFNPDGTGSGVNAYVVDTGIRPTHTEFDDGRASVFFDGYGGNGVDCNGHGTHCSGTVGGKTYGVAAGVTLFGLRVLTCSGSGFFSVIIAGMDYIVSDGNRPGVVSMSIGGGASQTTDDAVKRLTDAGFTVSVAAGNEDQDACNVSPARAVSAITVGATDSSDNRAYFSNWGSCLDIFAPGVDITSAWYNTNYATNTISGTSMACPHVTGAAALLLEKNPTHSAAQITSTLLGRATSGVVGDPETNSPNTFLYVGA